MISIITPTTTGGMTYLASLMPTIKNQTYTDYEFILIDNDSRDGTIPYMGNYDCLLKINKTKMNFSNSNNYGASTARGDYLLFLNNDTKLAPDTLEKMVGVFSLDEKIGIVGCSLYLNQYPHKLHHCGVMFTEKYEPYELGLAQPFGVPALAKGDPRSLSVREVPAVTAACMMVKKSVFEEVGGFDPGYHFGWEDVDINLKVREAGYKVYTTGQTRVLHHHFGSKDRGRFSFESDNRARYEQVWMTTGRAKSVLKGYREA